MVTVALVMGVVTTNIYAKKDSGHSPPNWIVNTSKRLYPNFLPPKEIDIAMVLVVMARTAAAIIEGNRTLCLSLMVYLVRGNWNR